VRLAIADPPYPPARDGKVRASRWYGDGQLASDDVPADIHAEAREWDRPERHRELLADLTRDFDGYAIATAPDAVRFYEPLPAPCKLLVWVRPNVQPGAHRIRATWEAVILYPPAGRRSNRGGPGTVDDVLVCPAPRVDFVGAKPPEWVEWLLACLGYDAETDDVVDVFPGSGLVSAVLAQGRLTLAR
jgi:hypothetical protein